MVAVLVDVLVPFLSALAGAFVTYRVNVRARRDNQIEDAFDSAIAAVSVADVSSHYRRYTGSPLPGLTAAAHEEMQTTIIRSGVENHFRRAAEAREALARVMHHAPALTPYVTEDQYIVTLPTPEVVNLLNDARVTALKAQRSTRRWLPKRN